MSEGKPPGRGTDMDLSQHDLSSESVVHSLVHSSPDNIMLLDLEHRVLFINWTVPQLTVEDVTGSRVYEFVPDSHHQPMKDCFTRVLASGQPDRYDTVSVTDDGSTFYWESSVGPVLRDGEVVAYAVTSRDMTERRALEDRLRQAQKMEAVGQLAGGVAHDFNNLLLVMRANAELARTASPDKVDRFLEQIDQSATRAADLTRKLLTFSRRQHMKLEATDLNAVVGETLAMVRRLIPKSIELRFEADPSIEHVRADATHINQVIVNLCLNGRDAMPDGGVLEVLTSRVEDGHKIQRADGAAARGHACLSVSDNGDGIDPEVKPHIFEPFFTTKLPGHGTGLGLATTYAIVQQHGGVLDVESQPGVGATFRVYLPLSESAAVAADPATREPAQRGRGETILVAEDEPMVRKTVTTILEDGGYRVVVADDGQQAVDRFERSRDRIALVLLDLVMPKLGGLEAWERIRELSPSATVLFTSGYGDAEAASGISQAQRIDKPYQSDELLRRIRAAIDTAAASADTA